MVTIKDIAKAAGVNVSTVSRSLNGSGRIPEETRKRILALCDEMGYMPNALARGLVKHSTGNIGMLVPNMANPFYSQLMVSFAHVLRREGLNMLGCNSFLDFSSEMDAYRLLVENKVDGIIIHPIDGCRLDSFMKYVPDMPTVFIGDIAPRDGIACVSTDNITASRMAVDHLAAKGVRSLALLGADCTRRAHSNRASGFSRAVEEKGLEGWIEAGRSDHVDTLERGYMHFMDMLSSGRRPDAVVAVSDSAAMGVMKGAREKGIAIPDDMLLTGFDNLNYSSFPNIGLTTVAPDRNSLVENAVEMLKKMISGGPSEERRVVSPVLFERYTSSRTLL